MKLLEGVDEGCDTLKFWVKLSLLSLVYSVPRCQLPEGYWLHSYCGEVDLFTRQFGSGNLHPPCQHGTFEGKVTRKKAIHDPIFVDKTQGEIPEGTGSETAFLNIQIFVICT